MIEVLNYIKNHLKNGCKQTKKRGLYSSICLLLLTSFTTFSQSCPTTNLVQDPPQFQWTYHPVSVDNPEAHYSGTMEVGEVTLIFNNGETLTTRAYRQEGTEYSIPGPTITMKPGNKYILKFHNTLPYEPLNTDHNVFKDPNATNIHTHGLHISGETPGDDVTRVFEGGRGGDFVWDIPTDHMGGTYWYHAHHHGSTFLQVSGGMFGMIIIDDSNDNIPSTVADMEEKQLVFGFLDPAAAGTGGDVLMTGSLSSTWTTNGVIGGTVCLPANTWQHWRVAIADRGAMLRDLEFGSECEVLLLARDGVWRTIAPKTLSGNTLKLTGASRADFAIRTSSNSTIKMNGNIIAQINVSSETPTDAHPYNIDGTSTWSAKRPNYLRDLRSETNIHTESVSMGARTVNGSKYNHHTPTFSLPATQVQEWSLSGNVRHPFHLHVYHVQALQDDRDFEAGEFYDVVASQMSVRFDLNQATTSPYKGRTIMHCHVLAHEDQGAMGWLNVEGGIGAPLYPRDANGEPLYTEYYILNNNNLPPEGPNNLVATAISSSTIQLNWSDNSSNEEGFHIERSQDGTNFSFITSVNSNINNFNDNGLTPNTTYYYRVSAYNNSGISDTSTIANATTFTQSNSSVHVNNVSIVTNTLNGGRFQAVATVYVVDQNNLPVTEVTVNGSFSGATSSTESGITNSSGEVVFQSRIIKGLNSDWCFEVANITHSEHSYDPESNTISGNCINNTNKSLTVLDVSSSGVFPNPFNDHTSISFKLKKQSNVSFEVYTIMGESVASFPEKMYSTGNHVLPWNTSKMAAGTYYMAVRVNGEIIHRHKLLLTR